MVYWYLGHEPCRGWLDHIKVVCWEGAERVDSPGLGGGRSPSFGGCWVAWRVTAEAPSIVPQAQVGKSIYPPGAIERLSRGHNSKMLSELCTRVGVMCETGFQATSWQTEVEWVYIREGRC